MSNKLAMNTTVEGVTYEAGTVPPAEVAKKIDNAKAWGEESAADEKPADPDPAPTPAPAPDPQPSPTPPPAPQPSPAPGPRPPAGK